MPSLARCRMAASRASSSNNLKPIAVALHNSHSTNRRLPPGNDRNNFSTAAYLLPYLEQVLLQVRQEVGGRRKVVAVVARRQTAIGAVGVVQCHSDRLEVVRGRGTGSGHAAPCQGWHQETGQERQEGHDDQQLIQREARSARAEHGRSSGKDSEVVAQYLTATGRQGRGPRLVGEPPGVEVAHAAIAQGGDDDSVVAARP